MLEPHDKSRIVYHHLRPQSAQSRAQEAVKVLHVAWAPTDIQHSQQETKIPAPSFTFSGSSNSPEAEAREGQPSSQPVPSTKHSDPRDASQDGS